MPEFCTCGAQLPPDARFCHKCAKPQYEMPNLEDEEATPAEAQAPVAAAIPVPVPIGFHNGVAVRIGMLTAGLAFLLISLLMPLFYAFLWLLLGLVSSGFFAVFLYSRRTGQSLSVGSGARMGWITGVFFFLIATVFTTINVVTIARGKGLSAFYKEQFSGRMGPDVNVDQVLRVLETPVGLASLLLFTLLMLFVIFTALPTLGGALGAKVMAKE